MSKQIQKLLQQDRERRLTVIVRRLAVIVESTLWNLLSPGCAEAAMRWQRYRQQSRLVWLSVRQCVGWFGKRQRRCQLVARSIVLTRLRGKRKRSRMRCALHQPRVWEQGLPRGDRLRLRPRALIRAKNLAKRRVRWRLRKRNAENSRENTSRNRDKSGSITNNTCLRGIEKIPIQMAKVPIPEKQILLAGVDREMET